MFNFSIWNGCTRCYAHNILNNHKCKIGAFSFKLISATFLRRSLSSAKQSPWLTRVCRTVSRTMEVSSPRHQGANLSTSLQMWPVSCSWRKGSVRRLPVGKSHLYHRGTWNTETRTIVPSTWTVWRLTYSDHWNCRLKSIGQNKSTCMRRQDMYYFLSVFLYQASHGLTLHIWATAPVMPLLTAHPSWPIQCIK